MTLVSQALLKAFPVSLSRYRKVRFGVSRGCYLPIDLTSQLRLLLGVYEAEIIRQFVSCVSSTSCCYDIGASLGYYTLAFSRLAPQGIVYAFEMDGKACENLRETISKNSVMSSNVHVLNCTVGRYGADSRGVTSIDGLVSKEILHPPSVMKLDVEGAEGDVLFGSAQVLKSFHPYLIVETHSVEVERYCIELLRKLDYDVEMIRRNRIMLENRPMAHNQWICAK